MRYSIALATLVGGTTLAATALADGGYYSGTLGARAAGRGGAFAARADDLTAVSHNPAGLATIDDTQVELGNILSYNGYSYTRQPTLDYGNPQGGVAPLATFGKVSNGKPWQALDPMLGVTSRLGRRDWAFALAAYAPPGVGPRVVSRGRRAALHDDRPRGDVSQVRGQCRVEVPGRLRRRGERRMDPRAAASSIR